MNIAIILAGGTGIRMKSDTPKQFIIMAGKTILEHSVDVFEKNTQIDEIAIVINESYFSNIEHFIFKNNWKKVKKILKGGKERFESSFAAINAYQQFPNFNLILHDVVRPLVSDRIINDVVKALDSYQAVTVAIPVTDTMYQVDNANQIIDIPNRSHLQRAQTPQAFKVDIIQKAYHLALQDAKFQSTDDCGVVAKYLLEEKIYVVRGEETNIKLTYKEDIYWMEKLFLQRFNS